MGVRVDEGRAMMAIGERFRWRARAPGRAAVLLLVGLAAGPAPAADFWFGADLSYVNEMEDCGAVYREHGQAVDPFELFARRGANLVRVRLWNDAEWTAYSDLPDVKKTIRRAREAGMRVLLDYHYSDEWADGDKQIVPKAWADIESTADLAVALHDFTLDTLLELHAAGLLPEMVQVGNETNPEILRGPEDGKEPIDWARNATLFNAGIRAVRTAAAQTGQDIRVMLHIAQPENVMPWFEAAWAAGVRDFDQVGVSYYRRWSSEDFGGLAKTLGAVKARWPEREVILVETAYPWTLEYADEAPNLLTENTLIEGYPATVEGQTRYLVDLTQLVVDAGGSGIVYWEPAWVSTACSTRWGQGSHWENATFFDFRNGNEVLPSIDFMRRDYTPESPAPGRG
jgi:arabinogalactan endo-1,4-beta-galactosidase